MTVEIRRADDRAKTKIAWLDSKHSFSFGEHYEPNNTHHGLLLVNNDDIVKPGTGFDTHPHRDMEIVTWVLRGSLVHQDSTGHSGIIYPGLAQRMSAGRGILHSEKNDSWRLLGGGLVTVASGMPQHDGASAIRIKNRYAALHAARLQPGQSVELPEAPYLHLFVPRGAVVLEGAGPLAEGDAVRFTATGGQGITANHAAR